MADGQFTPEMWRKSFHADQLEKGAVSGALRVEWQSLLPHRRHYVGALQAATTGLAAAVLRRVLPPSIAISRGLEDRRAVCPDRTIALPELALPN
jgi:hypothetical protein